MRYKVSTVRVCIWEVKKGGFRKEVFKMGKTINYDIKRGQKVRFLHGV